MTERRRRWKLEWLDFGPFYVEGYDLEEVVAKKALSLEWEDAVTNPENSYRVAESYDKHARVIEVGLVELKYAPRPGCCEKSDSTHDWLTPDKPYLQLSACYYDSKEDKVRYRPHWTIQAREVAIEIAFCPFCGTKLPAVRRLDNPAQPLWTPDPDYCGTCNERNRCCECNPPESAYVVVDA